MFEWLLENDQLASLLAFAIVLIPVIIIHELGHFIAGRSVGVTILEFGIGFPPRIGKMFTLWGTEFTLNWLPFGGFVRPLGEDMVAQRGEDMVDLDRQEAKERGLQNIKAVSEAQPLERIWFLSAGALFNILTAFVVFIVIGLIGIPGESLQVIQIEEQSILSAAGIQANDVVYDVNGQTFLLADDFFNYLRESTAPTNISIRRGESGDPIQVTLDEIPAIDTQADDDYVYIVGVADSSPADLAGMQPGDVVKTFNGDVVRDVPHLVLLTGENLGEEIELGIDRSGDIISVSLTPRENPPDGGGAMGIRIDSAYFNNDLGLTYRPLLEQTIVPLPFLDAVEYSALRFRGIFLMIASLPRQLTSGEISPQEARPISIVGISQVGGVFLQETIERQRPIELLNFIAIISIALGFTNLLPLPALDGGRILFVLIEMVRGKPIPPERESIVHLLGLAFLLSLTVIIVINDIINPVTDLIR